MATARETGKESPSILSKAFDLLRSFNEDRRVMTLTELSRACGLPKSTVHRLLARLVELEAVEDNGNGYKISLSVLALASTAPAHSLRQHALPHLVALQRWTGQTVHLAVLRGIDVVYLEKVTPPRPHVALSRVGARLPAACTAVGKVLLAHEDPATIAALLPDVLPRLTAHSVPTRSVLEKQLRSFRETGIAQERDEAVPGVSCSGVPIVLHAETVGAVSVSHPTATPPRRGTETVLRETAAAISAALATDARHSRHHDWMPARPGVRPASATR